MQDTLKTLMDFHSVSDNQEAVRALLDYAAQRLSQKGLIVEHIQHNGVNNLYASVSGQKHASVMLQGHIDVVPGGETFVQEGDTIRGRGSFDMLFATASFLTLIDNIDDISKYDISVLLTGDEELGGSNGVEPILTDGYTCDVCILPDAGDKLGEMSVAAKGLYHVRVRINGTAHHGSRPWEGDGAASKLVHFIDELSDAFDTSDHNNSTFVISQLQAGSTALNQGPGEAFAGFDIRYKDAEDFLRIKAHFDALLVKYTGEIVYEQLGRHYALDTKRPLVRHFINTYNNHLGHEITQIKSHGSSDARYFDDKNIPVIMFRPDGGNAHGDGEWLSQSSWQTFHDILTDYVLSVSQKR